MRSLHETIHPSELEINLRRRRLSAQMAGNKKQSKKQKQKQKTGHIRNPLNPWNSFVSIQLSPDITLGG